MDQLKDNPFPFLSLPAEIREKIYSHLLVWHRILISYNQTLPSRSTTSKPTTTPKGLIAITELPNSTTITKTRFELPTTFASPTTNSILLTNRQLHHEASFILYTKNTFDFTTMPAVAPFLSLIGPRNRPLLQSIRLSSWNRLGWKAALGALADVEGLRVLRVAVWKFDTYEAQWGVFLKELWEGLQGQVANVRFCVGGEAWERGGGNVMGSRDVEVLGRSGLGMADAVYEGDCIHDV